MMLSALFGAALWLAYGTLRADWAVVMANLLAASLVASLVVMKIRYAKRRASAPQEPGGNSLPC